MIHELEKELTSMPDQAFRGSPSTAYSVFDFMLHACTIAVAAASSMKTFGETAEIILNRTISPSRDAQEVNAVFDIYQENSIKAEERLRSMKPFQAI